MSYDHFHHEMIARGVTDETLDTIRKCGINLDHWLEGFKDTPESVRKTIETIKTAQHDMPELLQFLTLVSFSNAGEPLEVMNKLTPIELVAKKTSKDYTLRCMMPLVIVLRNFSILSVRMIRHS